MEMKNITSDYVYFPVSNLKYLENWMMRERNETFTIFKDDKKRWKIINYSKNWSLIEKCFFWFMKEL